MPADLHHLKWYLLHTKSRQEKAVAESLASMRVHFVLPLIRKNSFYGKRKVEVELPLFPGYVFMRGERDEVFAADRTKRIANIIPVTDEQTLIAELDNLQKALAAAEVFDPYPYLKIGVRVEVRTGPLQGVRGLIEDRAKRNRLILQIDMLGQATSIEMDGNLLEPLE